MSNSLDTDQARHFVGLHLGPNWLQRLSADDTSRQRVKKQPEIAIVKHCAPYMFVHIFQQGPKHQFLLKYERIVNNMSHMSNVPVYCVQV